jgi:ferredoxin-NADP reductase
MKQFAVRAMAALGIVTSLGLGMSGAASAGGHSSGGTTTTTTISLSSALKTYQKQLTAYHTSRNAIEATFRTSIQMARSTYQKAMLTATTSAERSAAEQAKVTAIISAAYVRSQALTALGSAPTPPSS